MITTGKKLVLTLHSDSGHAWLAVPQKLLKKFGVADQICAGSRQQGSMVYLDEDVDAFLFADAAEAAGVWIRVVRRHEEPTPILGYPAYSASEKTRIFRMRGALSQLANRIPLVRRPRHEA